MTWRRLFLHFERGLPLSGTSRPNSRNAPGDRSASPRPLSPEKAAVKAGLHRAFQIRKHGDRYVLMIERENRTSTHELPADIGEEIDAACVDIAIRILMKHHGPVHNQPRPS